MNRANRRKTKGIYAEATHKIMIADLQVMTNPNVPDGYMIVSPNEADRLQDLVDKATAEAGAKLANDKPKEEGKDNGTV